MSLLNLLNSKDPAVNQGLLQMGLALLQSKGNFGSAIGQAGLQGLQGAQQFQDRQGAQQRAKLQEQLMQGQLGQVKRAEQMALLPGQFYRAPSAPGVDATGGMETDLANPANEANPQGRFDMAGYQSALMGMDPLQALDLRQRLAKPAAPLVAVGNDQSLFDPTSRQVVYSGPGKAEKPTNDIQEFEYAKRNGEVAQGVTFTEWMRANKRSGASNVNVGEKLPVGYRWTQDGDLTPIKGGPADKLPEKQQNTVVGAQNLRGAIAEYRTQLQGWSKTDLARPDARAAMGTKYKNMMLQAKEAYNLGVLNGPDLAILESVITDPVSFTGAITSKAALDKQAAELDRIISKIERVASQRDPRKGGASGDWEPASGADLGGGFRLK